MVRKKAQEEQKKHPVEVEGYDQLYISMQDASNKRKNILLSVKNTLMMQEEHERVVDIRKTKIELINQIKKEMDELNTRYQGLKKLLPNVKNVISYTEKELSELEDSVKELEESVSEDKGKISEGKRLEAKLASGTASGVREAQEKKTAPPKETKKKEPATRLDRIQNNLKVIEGKLKGF